MEKKMGSIDDFAEFASIVTRLLPRNMDAATMQNWILNPSDLTDVLREALMPMSKKQSDKLVNPSDTLAAKYGFKVEKDDDVQPSQFEAKNIKLKTFLEDGEGQITGEEVRKRALAKKGNFGLVDGERWKNEMNNSKDKFKKWQGKYIVLPGTLLRDSNDHLRVAFLYWNGDSWEFNFFWLDNDWLGHDQFACGE